MGSRRARELDPDDHAVGLLLYPDDPTGPMEDLLGPDADLELLPEVDLVFEDGPKTTAADAALVD